MHSRSVAATGLMHAFGLHGWFALRRPPSPSSMATLSSSPPDLGRVNTAADAAIDHRDSMGLSALMVAAAAGDAESVTWLIQAGARIDLTCKLGANACDYAFEAGLEQARSTQLLIGAGGRPSALSEQVRAEITRRRLEREARSRSAITSPRAAADHTKKSDAVVAGSPGANGDDPTRGAFVGSSVTNEGLATLSMLTSAPDHVFAGLFSPPPLQQQQPPPPQGKDRVRSARRDIPGRLVTSDQRDSASSSPTRAAMTSDVAEPAVRASGGDFVLGDYFSPTAASQPSTPVRRTSSATAAAPAGPPVTPPRAQQQHHPQLRLAGGSPLSHSFSASGSPLAGGPTMPRPSSFQGSPVSGSPNRSGSSTPTAGSSPAKRAPAARAFISSSPWKMGGAMTKRQIVPPAVAKPTTVPPPASVPALQQQQQQQTMPAPTSVPRSQSHAVEPSYDTIASALARAAEQQQQQPKLRLGIRDAAPLTASFTDALQQTPSKLRRPNHTVSSSSRNPAQLADSPDGELPQPLPPAHELQDLTHAGAPISPATTTTAPGTSVEYVHPSVLSPTSLDHLLQRAQSSSSAATAGGEGASTPGSLSSSLSSSPATWLPTHVGSIPGSGSSAGPGAGAGLAGSSPGLAGSTIAGLGAIHSHNLAHQRVMSKASAGPAQPSSAAAHQAIMGISASPPTHTHGAASFMVTGSLAAHHHQQQRSLAAAASASNAAAAAPPSSPSPSVPLRESDVMRVRDLVEYMAQVSEVSGADVSFRNAFLLTLPYFAGASSSSAASGSTMAQGLREILDLLLAHLFRPAVAPSTPVGIPPAPIASAPLASPVPSRVPAAAAPALSRSQSALNPGRTPSPSTASGLPPSAAAGAASPSLTSWRASKLRIFSVLKYWIKAYPQDFLHRMPPPPMVTQQGSTTPTASAAAAASGGRRMSVVDEHDGSARTIAAHVSARLQRFPPVSWPSAHTAGLAKLCSLTIQQLSNLPALLPQLQSPVLRTALTLQPRLSRHRPDSSSAKGSWLLRAGLESLVQTVHVYTILRLKDVRSPRELLKTQRASPGMVGLTDDSASRKQSTAGGDGAGEPLGRNQMRISNNVSLWVCTELLTVGLTAAQLAALPASVSFSADAPAILADPALQSPALVAQRLALFRRFVSLAYRLLLPPYSNFNAAFEVLQALSVHAWHRLLPKVVDAFLAPGEASALKKIMGVVASAENYKSYRNLLAGSGATTAVAGENIACDPAQFLASFPREWPDAATASAPSASSSASLKIPYLGVLFKDLVSLEDGQPPLVVAPPQQSETDEDAAAATGPLASPLSPLSPSSPSSASFASFAWPVSPVSSLSVAPPSRVLDTQVNFSKCRCLANMVFDALACQRVVTAMDCGGTEADDEDDDGGSGEAAFPLATEHELRMLMDAMSASMSETELNALSERIQPRLARVSGGGARSGVVPAPAPPAAAVAPRTTASRVGPSPAVTSVTLAVPSHSSGAASRLAGSSGSSSLSNSPTGRSSSASITFSPSDHDSGSDAGSQAPSLSASLDAPTNLRQSRAAAGLSSEDLAAHFSLVRRPGDASDLFSASSSGAFRGPFASLPSSSPDSPCSPPATLRGDLPDFQPFLHGALMFSESVPQQLAGRREVEQSIARHASPPGRLIASITEETHAQASSRTASDADAPPLNQRRA